VCVVEVGASGTRSYSGHRQTRVQAKCARLVEVGDAMTSLRCVRVRTARLCPRQALKRPKPFCAPTHSDRTGSTVRSRYKRQLIRLNMKKKWPTRTGMEDSRPIFFCKRFSYNENAL